MKTRVPKKYIATHVRARDIKEFVDFLNGKNLHRYHLLWHKRRLLAPEMARALRTEILNDLLPLTDTEAWKMESFPYRLQAFLDKLNEVRFTWQFDLIGLLGKNSRSFDSMIDADAKSEYQTRRVVRIGGFRWRVGISVAHDGSARSRLYNFLLRLFESGELERLRKCRNCTNFFFRDIRYECCGAKCKRDYDKFNAANREERRERIQAAHAVRVRDQKAFACFTNFMNLVKKPRCSGEEQNKRTDILKGLGEGTPRKGWKIAGEWERRLAEGVSLQAMFKELTPQQWNVFDRRANSSNA